MKLSHSIAMTTLCVSLGALAAACGEEAEPGDGGATGGSSGTATGGTSGSATGGTSGSATGGTSGSATGGSAGSATGGAGGSGGSATGGSGGSGGSGGGMVDYPGSSQAEIEAFLAGNTYTMTGMGWRPEAMATDGMGVPHTANKRYFNETLIASRAAMMTGSQTRAGSMSVKDLLTNGAVVGKAAILRGTNAQGNPSWVFYCTSTEEGRCYSNSPANMKAYGTTATAANCACHSQGFVSGSAIPTP
jgi:hypothetical protein